MAEVKRVVFFAQDEGSAKALVPVIRSMPARAKMDMAVVAGRHAARTFRQNGVDHLDSGSCPLGEAFSPRPDLVVTGASMRASIEKEAIAFARKAGITSVTLLDSRIWFWWRFTVGGVQNLAALPDHILVPDHECMERMICERFPAVRLVPTGNPHFDVLLNRPVPPGKAELRTVLVVTQPEYRNGTYQSDLSWLKTILTICRQLDADLRLTIRPHSKEGPHAFDSLLQRQCQVDVDSDILDLIESHQLVIGKNSSALLEAALLGKMVISFAHKKSDLLISPIDVRGLFHQATKNDDLRGLISDGINQRLSCQVPYNIPYYTDGRNGERVLDCLIKILKD
jgi:hypothetical protein